MLVGIGFLTLLIAAASERFVAADVEKEVAEAERELEADVQATEAEVLRELAAISERLKGPESTVRRLAQQRPTA